MVVILILGGPSTTHVSVGSAPSTHNHNHNNGHVLVNHLPPSRYGRQEATSSSSSSAGPPYRGAYNRSLSATNNHHLQTNQSYHCYQKTPPHEETRGCGNYFRSLSVPQVSLRIHDEGDTKKAKHRQSCSFNHAEGAESPPPLIRHITRVNICDASPQLDLATGNYGAIATTEAEPVTREGECQLLIDFLLHWEV